MKRFVLFLLPVLGCILMVLCGVWRVKTNVPFNAAVDFMLSVYFAAVAYHRYKKLDY